MTDFRTSCQSTNSWYFCAPWVRNTSLGLGDHFAEFIEEQTASGRFSAASEVVREGLRLLEENEARLSALRAALVEGELSGEPEPFDFNKFLDAKRKLAIQRR